MEHVGAGGGELAQQFGWMAQPGRFDQQAIRPGLAQQARHLADGRVEGHRVLGRLPRGLDTRHHLHQRDEMRRIERVADQKPARILHQLALLGRSAGGA